jgi:hypothetical protein
MSLFKKFFLLKEQEELQPRLWGYNDGGEHIIGPVYHGGGWNGINVPLIRDGEMGTGIYFTNSKERALSYTNSSWRETQGRKAGKGKYLVEATLRLTKPIIVPKEKKWPPFYALVSLGMKPEKADNILNKHQERTGNTGPAVRKLGESTGHDGLIIHRDSDIEYVVWQPYNVKVVNVEQL